jgi:hypothetical protein
MLIPTREFPFIRKFGQLLYELLNISSNLAPEDRDRILVHSNNTHLITGMHPHGIVPFQALIWTAFCEQYLTDWDEEPPKRLYGFGAAANAVDSIPFLRNFMGWLSAGNASYSTLKNGLMHGICQFYTSGNRKPEHLFVLPGGVAEIFTSQPGKHVIVFKKRRGLIKLSIETGAELVPTYVFGGTDFFFNLATDDSWLSRVSRKMKMGLTWFWGRWWLPIPFHPRVTLVMGDPLPVPRWDGKSDIPEDLIEQLHAAYIAEITRIFDTYKVAAGLDPGSKLEVR